MKIKVEKWITDEYNKSYKIISIDKCCDKITQSQNITLNNEYAEDDVYSDDNTYSVKLIRKEEDCDPWEDYHQMIYYYEKINFCPFCGQSISIEIVNEVDKTEEYNKLHEQRDILWKKHNKTDSKKKAEELYKQVHELDIKIDTMLMSDDLDEEMEEDDRL